MIEKYDFEEIKFWRTINKQEIDFVIDEKEAFEVKVKPIKKKGYKLFLETYPYLKFSFVSLGVKENKIDSLPIKEVYQI